MSYSLMSSLSRAATTCLCRVGYISTTLFTTVALLLTLQGASAVTYPAANATNFPSGTYDDGVNPVPMNYRYFIPKDYDANDTGTLYPLVLFLHGAGEKGTENNKQLNNNANKAMIFISSANPDNQTDFPCFWVAPQVSPQPDAPGTSDWSTHGRPAQVQGVLDQMIAQYNIDPDRIYITGLSMGGNGVMSQLLSYPGRYAAANPNCGWLGSSSAAGIEHMPLWAFHCANDGAVSVNGSDNIVGKMRDLGGQPIYTRYDTGGHSGAWTRAYNPQTPLVSWMMAQRRGQAPVSVVGPYINLTSHNNGDHISTTADSIDIAGDADANTTSVSYINRQYNSVTNSVNGTTSWDVTVTPLRNDKENKIYIEAESIAYSAVGNGLTTVNTTLYVNRVPVGSDAVQPILTITQPIDNPIYSTIDTTIDIAGTVSDDVAVTNLTWENHRGGSGSIPITNPWQYDDLPVFDGLNIITITALDAAGNKAVDTIHVISNANQAPHVATSADQSVYLADGATLGGIVIDDGRLPGSPTPTTTWSLVSGPGTVSFGDVNAIDTTATFSIDGVYVLELSASDGVLTGSDTVTITVTIPSDTPIVLYDFGTQSLPAGNWNLVRNAALGDEVLDAIDTNGDPTSFDLRITDAFKSRDTTGLSGTGLYPDEATTDSYFVSNANLGEITFEDLNPNRTYKVTIFASASLDSQVLALGDYTIDGNTQTLNAADNSNQTVVFNNISPDASGHIVLACIASGSSGEAFINVIELEQLPQNTPNTPPVVDAGADQTVGLAVGATLDATVTDDGLSPGNPTPTTTWSMVSGPGTVSFGDASAIDTSATFSVIGTYVLELFATDGDLSSTDTVTITVDDTVLPMPEVTVLYDFGTQFYPSTGNWNLVRYAALGDEVLDAIDTDGNPTPFDLRFTDAFKGRDATGLTGTGLYPDDATYDSYYVNNANLGEITFEDLDPDQSYRLTIFASAALDPQVPALGDYTINGNTQTFNAADNTSQTIVFDDISPEASGHIVLACIASGNTGEAFINVIELTQLAQVIPNTAPNVDAGLDQIIDLPVGASLDATVTDDGIPPGDPTPTTIWSMVSGTGTVLFGDANAIDTSATFSVAGTYVLELFATDGDLSSADTVTITVNEVIPPAPELTVRYDFGTRYYPSTGNWNLVRYAALGDEVLDAIDTEGNSTPFDLRFTDAFKGRDTTGLIGTGLYPDDATYDSYYVSNANLGEITFEDLDPDQLYNLTIFASAALDPQVSALGDYTINGNTQTLNAADNTSQTIVFNDISPDASGNIVLACIASGNTGEAFINVIELTQLPQVTSSQAPVAIAYNDSVNEGVSVAIDVLENDTSIASDLTSVGLSASAIGAGASGNSRVLANGDWEVNGAGLGLVGTTDSIVLETETVSGDFQALVKVNSLSGGTVPLAGLALRETVSPDSRTVAVASSLTNNYQVASRAATTSSLTWTISTASYVYPDAWVLLERMGDDVHVAVSSDGVTFTEIDVIALASLSPSVEVGIFSNSGSAGENSRAVFSNYTIVPL
ncbi:PKD domain-containing protein [Rubellicoccus peritrichatus]|uniref:Alpha/beta hydrolase-fold protein n=1 Tax=Rubellicoccus peritrichatus TaxID=3080537 RepID=A0AAQ3L542_9BACT|nr:alpha/beta hydrolase-fold protein [Puniceicoccus sp. CR14]WOO39305.1 alpha/beta hydrolase-fold protein [Puniceicoccus sp. CR14]